MTRYAVLLRGVNVGGRSTVAMAHLRELAEGLGWTGVTTYITSGNLFAECGPASQAEVEQALAGAVQEALGRPVAVVARTRDQLQQVVDRNPFPDAEPRFLHVVFLDGTPSAAGRRAFDDELARHPERGAIVGTEVYVDYVNGAGRSKLDWDRVARADGVTGTARNWNTVRTLLDRV